MCTMVMAIQAMCKNLDEVLDVVQSLIPNILSLHKQQTGHFSQRDLSAVYSGLTGTVGQQP